MAIIEVNELVKEFKVKKKKKGLRGAILNLFYAEKMIVRAVDNISFDIKQGEIVGYIGPNGAGKSTTVKMMSGILHPTSGSVMIDGISPQSNRKKVVAQLGVVFGQRTQLYWDLRLGESFELLKRIYNIDHKTYKKNLDLMDKVLKINTIINRPVRQLSLGQRMRGDLAAAMLHSPKILFLDEPTIGLDIEAKHSVRNFIRQINRELGITVILTTHDLDDVQQLCNRLIVINDGKKIEDGPLDILIDKMAPYRLLVVDMNEENTDFSHEAAQIIKTEGQRVWYRFEKNKITASQLISELSKKYAIKDISVEEPDIEEAIREIYKLTYCRL
ncbi:MAG: ATP-binding cassette domain-containing protein [Firmicutes bacterium]|nr:ATP-binding cassette domain-containing protein [Bacillota bacterium]